MAGRNRNVGNAVPRCFKHHPTWQSRVQQMLNKLRDSLIPKIYLGRFNNMLCTCGQGYLADRPDIANTWDDVTDEQLEQAITYIDNFIAQNIGNANVPILKKLMEWLRKDKEINEENSSSPQPAARSSALKLLYMLQKSIEKIFTIMEPYKAKKAVKPTKKEKSELVLTVILDGYKPELLGQLVGCQGRNIMTFMKDEKCHVRFEKFQSDGVEKVKATIKKTTEDMSVMEKIAEELKTFAKDTQEIVESYVPDPVSDDEELTPEVLSVYDEVDQMNQGELKEEFKELVEAADTMGPRAEFIHICTFYEENSSTRYKAITRKMPLVNQIQAFNEVKSKLVTQATPQSPAIPISSLSIGQSRNTENTTPLTAASSSSSTNTTQASQSGASTSAAAASQMAESSTVVHAIDLSDPGAADPCPTKCLVHDRRWVSTYQYALTQCYTHIRLAKKLGSRFSRLICTCNKPRPEARLYFVLESYLSKGFEQCKEMIEKWPQECQTIMKPLITQLEKYDKSEVWHSLFKFVYYFNAVNANLMDVLDNGHKLPGQSTAYVPRTEKPYFYQASLPLTVVKPTGSTMTPSLSSLAGASGTSTVQSGAGAAGSSIFSRSYLSRSSSSTSESDDQTKKKRATLKRLCPDDWSDDCYYHGKKKKFVFQCVVNYLHKNAGLPVKLNIPYSMAVCVCNETVDFNDFYKTELDCRADCRTMKIKLNLWRGDSKASIQPYIKLLEDYINNKIITDGFLKLVYHFNQVYKRELAYYEELHHLVKKQRNAKKI